MNSNEWFWLIWWAEFFLFICVMVQLTREDRR